MFQGYHIIRSQLSAQTCWLSDHFYFVNCDRKEIYFLTIFSINVCQKSVTQICPRMLENMAKRVLIFIFRGDSMPLDLPRTCKTRCVHNLTQLSLLVFSSDHTFSKDKPALSLTMEPHSALENVFFFFDFLVSNDRCNVFHTLWLQSTFIK